MAWLDLKMMRFHLEVWVAARTLPFDIYRRSLAEILQWLQHSRASSYPGLSIEYVVACVRRSVRRPFVMRDRRCLREGLLAYRFLRAAGYAPNLHFGIDRSTLSGASLTAHCWVVCDGKIVLNSPGADMVQILIWPDAAAELPTGLSEARFD